MLPKVALHHRMVDNTLYDKVYSIFDNLQFCRFSINITPDYHYSEPPTTLDNIRQRLKLMCGGKMEIVPREAGGTMVRMTIPTEIQKYGNWAIS